ncbi:MAG: large conductance mechanosensitive channel protein MscL [Clostridia bacterium]|nr:large conductance mechanosensitive channel protein MscL [Clostridia bacterium]
MKKFFEEFKVFAMRGNVVDMAIGVIIGGAFGKITTSMVNDIFMPLLGILTGGVNFGGMFYALDGNQYASIEAATEAGVGTLNYGAFIQYIIDFVLVAFCMFLVIRLMNGLKKKEEATVPAPEKAPRLCPYCRMEIADDATRCGHCTSQLDK